MPMVRDYSTSGGHLAGVEVIEGTNKTVTKKWQGYPPENLNVLGKARPALPEVSIPRFTGKAQYASRVWFADLLYTNSSPVRTRAPYSRTSIRRPRRKCRA